MSSNDIEPAPSAPSSPEREEYERIRQLEIRMYAQRQAIDRGQRHARVIPTFATREEEDAWWASERRRLDELGRLQRENWRRRQGAEKAAPPPAEE